MHTMTSQYQFSHGKQPRGQGNWLLDLVIERDRDGAFVTEQFQWNGTLAEAKAAAKRKVKTELSGCTLWSIEVLP